MTLVVVVVVYWVIFYFLNPSQSCPAHLPSQLAMQVEGPSPTIFWEVQSSLSAPELASSPQALLERSGKAFPQIPTLPGGGSHIFGLFGLQVFFRASPRARYSPDFCSCMCWHPHKKQMLLTQLWTSLPRGVVNFLMSWAVFFKFIHLLSTLLKRKKSGGKKVCFHKLHLKCDSRAIIVVSDMQFRTIFGYYKDQMHSFIIVFIFF